MNNYKLERENLKQRLNCNDEELEEIIAAYNRLVVSGNGGSFDEFISTLERLFDNPEPLGRFILAL